MHLVSLLDIAQRCLIRGRLCYVASYDVAGAFARVTNVKLVRGLERFGIDGYTRRVLHNWMRLRTCQVRLKLPSGVWFSSIHPISRGGVIPPLLWLVSFNSVPRQLAQGRYHHPVTEVAYRAHIYADDVTSLIAANN